MQRYKVEPYVMAGDPDAATASIAAADAKVALPALKVDGGAVANNFLCQFQADVLDAAVHRPRVIETTALGAAFLAGLGSGLWRSLEILASRQSIEISPSPSGERRSSTSGSGSQEPT